VFAKVASAWGTLDSSCTPSAFSDRDQLDGRRTSTTTQDNFSKDRLLISPAYIVDREIARNGPRS